MTEPELTYPPRRRLGRLRLVTGLDALVLHLPNKCFRGPYRVNMDAAYVDRRRLKRARRRHALAA